MSKLIVYFPGGDTPLECDGGSDIEDDDSEEDLDDTDCGSSSMSHQLSTESNRTPTTITLPQPTSNMMQPLQLETDPVRYHLVSNLKRCS